ALTLCLFPVWPVLSIGAPPPMAVLAGWAIAEAAFGMLVGLAVSFLAEGFQLAAQLVNLQAGYSYASAVDPNSEADSTVLQLFMQLTSSLLFFSLGLDRQVIRIFASSFQWFPVGSFPLATQSAEGIIRLGTAMFVTGLKLAMPVIALLLLVDIALSLFGRMQAQLQLLSLAFPIKMLTALAILTALAAVLPAILERAAAQTFEDLLHVLRP
ncbi:MAG: flagellar biosynthetic protein FliR, partial [Bryobacteraceae bacterium]